MQHCGISGADARRSCTLKPSIRALLLAIVPGKLQIISISVISGHLEMQFTAARNTCVIDVDRGYPFNLDTMSINLTNLITETSSVLNPKYSLTDCLIIINVWESHFGHPYAYNGDIGPSAWWPPFFSTSTTSLRKKYMFETRGLS